MAQQFTLLLTQIRRPARKDFTKDRPQAEYVAALVQPVHVPAGLLWGHVGGRTEDRACRRFGVGPFRPYRAHRPAFHHLGESPIHHLDFAEGANHDVERLEIAVNHAAGVGVGQRLTELLEDFEEPR